MGTLIKCPYCKKYEGYHKIYLTDTSYTCPICYELYTNNLGSLMCGHVFCINCIENISKISGSQPLPILRNNRTENITVKSPPMRRINNNYIIHNNIINDNNLNLNTNLSVDLTANLNQTSSLDQTTNLSTVQYNNINVESFSEQSQEVSSASSGETPMTITNNSNADSRYITPPRRPRQWLSPPPAPNRYRNRY